ncbi:hypothetical protein [Helicobacter pylori]|nr:hypothetical protein [Helicobacter pylori]
MKILNHPSRKPKHPLVFVMNAAKSITLRSYLGQERSYAFKGMDA